MTKIKELIKSPHIHVSLATGFSIIVMAFVSKRVLTEPLGYLPSAIPLKLCPPNSYHSYFNDSTGLAHAAFRVCEATARNAVNR